MACVNFDKKIIYFHVPKTGGSYLEMILESNYDFVRYNWAVRNDFHIFNEYNKKKFLEYKDYLNLTPYSNRLFGIVNYYFGSDEIIKQMTLSREKLDEYKKFTFVRNPYTRFISGWNFIMDKPNLSENLLDNDTYGRFIDLEYFIDNRDDLSDLAYNHIFLSQYEQLIDHNNIYSIDEIYKFENMEEELERFLSNNFFEKTHKVISINKSKNNNYYKTYYTNKILDFVNETFSKDFEMFGYKKYDNLENFIYDKDI